MPRLIMPFTGQTPTKSACMASIATCLFSVLILSFSTPVFAIANEDSKNSFHIDFDLTSKSDDNIGQAQLDTDIIEDTIYESQAAMSYTVPIDDKQAYSFGASFANQNYTEVRTLNNYKLGLSFNFLWQNELGYTAPLYSFTFRITDLNSESDQRDSTIFNSLLTINSKFTDAMSLTMGLGYKVRDSDSNTFDLKDSRLFFSWDHIVGKNGTAYITASAINGQVFSIARPGAGDDSVTITLDDYLTALQAGASNIQDDDALNDHYGETDWKAYRVDANTATGMVGFNYGIGHNLAVDFSALYVDVQADSAGYQRQIFSASLLKRF